MSNLTKIRQECSTAPCHQFRVFKQVFDNSLTATAILDRSFNFIYVNHKYAANDGRTVEEFRGRNHFEMYPSDAKAIFEEVVHTKTPYQVFSRPFVYAHDPARGITYWDWTLVPVLDDDGEVELLLFSLNNVTKRKQAENELDRFFELSPDLLCVINMEDFRYSRTNRAFQRTLGYSEAELRGQCTDYIPPEDRDMAVKYLQELKTCHSPLLLTTRYKCKDGSYKLLRWNAVPSVEESRIYAVIRDVTEEKQFQDEMVRLERMKLIGEMAAMIGHEVRNPMTTVSAFLQLLAEKGCDNKYKQTFQTVIRELDRAAAIITRFTSLAKDNPVTQQPRNINDVLLDLLPLIEASAAERCIEIRSELKDVPDFPLNREEICQLVLNLVRNGIEAMASGGLLTIRTFVDGDKVILGIQDQGTGINPEIMDKIGTPFFTTKEEGTGLGMLVCRNIVERHHAELGIHHQDVGTLISVEFQL